MHVVLYSHYLVSILNPEYGRSGWYKKYITQMQMVGDEDGLASSQFAARAPSSPRRLFVLPQVQFGFISAHYLQLLLQPSCTYPKFTVAVIVPQNAFLCLLFYDFYRRTYGEGWSHAKPAAAVKPTEAAEAEATDGGSRKDHTAPAAPVTSSGPSSAS